MDNLVGTRGIADLLGLKHSESVHTWRRRYDDFPKPLAHVDGVWLWNWPDVEAWARKTGRYPVKPERDSTD